VIHGGAFVVWLVLRILAAFLGVFAVLLLLWLVIWFFIRLVGLIVALQAGGRRVSFPVLGPMAQQYVPMVEGWAK
jgi:uncharacterized membrane protein